MSFFAELKRRNVFKVGIAYAVATWLLLQMTDVISEILILPEWAPKLILLILIIGFVPALIFAWAFEMTPEGIKREHEVDRSQSITPTTGRKLDFAIIGLLAIGLVYFIWESRFSSGEKGSEPFSQDTSVQTAEIADEKRDPTPAFGADDKSIAVLPFTNRSPNADDIYFTDGVHDDLLTQLAKIDAFSVISRTSVMEYRDTAKNLKQIAAELGVANVMEGAVQRAGNQVRINVQLIDAETDEHLWAEVYDRELTTENLFKIQSEIARHIADALQATLTEEQIASVAEAPTDNVEAYELYQQARRFAFGVTEIGYETAVELYTAALELDPDFKLAWIGLADAHITQYWSYGGDTKDRDKARAAIDRARAIDPDFPELYMAEGFYWYWGHLDYERAIGNLEKAIEQMPGNAEALMWLGWATRRNGQWEKAIEAMGESVRLNPRVIINLSEYSSTLLAVGRYSEGIAIADQAYASNPDSYWAKFAVANAAVLAKADLELASKMMIGAQHTGDTGFLNSYIFVETMARNYPAALEAIDKMTGEMEVFVNQISLRESLVAWIHHYSGRDEEARASALTTLQRLDELQATVPYDYRHAVAMGEMHAILGNRDEVLRLAEETLALKPHDAVRDHGTRYSLAKNLAMVGETEQALEALDRVLTTPGFTTANFMTIDPGLDLLRDNPDFIALLEKHQ